MDITAMQLLHDFARACPRLSLDQDAWQRLYRDLEMNEVIKLWDHHTGLHRGS